ncbi:MAG: Type 1 glutamine amidotransferase-like domain-containing protein [Candidatus Bathyarchaeia archaeon]|jgi:peptidase E
MPKLYLLGGENVYRRSAKEVNQKAFEDTAVPRRVLVFAWARASFDRHYQKRKLFADYMRSLGASFVDFIEYNEGDNLAEKIEASNLIYLTGGQPSVLMERAKAVGLEPLLRNYGGVIVGRSAGALALCSRFVSTIRSNSKVRVAKGLGLVDITLKAHYTTQKDEALRRFSLETPIFALPTGSALVCDNGEFSTIGDVYLFRGGERRVYTKGV